MTTTTAFPETLMNRPFFRWLSEAHLQLLLDCAHRWSVKYGEYLISEGDPARQFFIVLEGRVEIEQFAGDLGGVTIESIGPGAVLGALYCY